MKLQNLLPHMAGKAVLVNGTKYQLNAEGVVNVPNETDAAKLLASKSWRAFEDSVEAPTVPQKASEPQPQPAPPPEPPKAPVEAETASDPGSDAGGEGKDPEEEWPDPDESMKKGYLQEMADAYEVEYTPKTTKKELVDAIMDKMYG